ncbi:hypothetical protein PVK06_005110 [Gossypium arboreum]|uniref:Reverse transcriptase zinc-binding domain-containing protein n=1 Tax=Gossypium arboreum TaxID=29729 RepID=A0ABR0QV02_GOSAR|nr:hypothetical protein PVK06_005110 [Gossypium arboreum]
MGCGWHVGNGRSILVLEDAWLPRNRPCVSGGVWGVYCSEYTVRSGYRLLLRGFPMTDGDRYNNIGQDTRLIYRKLWEANVPDKMKINCWRFIKNYMPTKSNLFQRQIGPDRMCSRCGIGPKTNLHACRDCPGVLDVWQQLRITWTLLDEMVDVPIVWIGQLFSNDAKQTQFSIITLWAIWNSRNKIIYEGIYQSS